MTDGQIEVEIGRDSKFGFDSEEVEEMARSPLFGKLRGWLRESAAPRQHGISRREFGAIAVAAAMPLFAGAKNTTAGIAIVGAGVAGLHAAWLMKKQGVRATVYESSNRAGGRMFSATGLLADGITTELGGEFIDTVHPEILGLAKTFGLDVMDMFGESEAGLKREAYLFGGELRREEEILSEFRQVVPQLERDIRKGARRFDRMSIEEYLDLAGVRGWVRGIIEVALRTEYGMEPGEQSAMNFLSLVSTDTSGDRVRWFGESDERYKIRGGNESIVAALASEVREQIMLDRRLVDVGRDSTGAYQLTFDKSGGGTDEVKADVVLLTVPFTVLRDVRLRVDLPMAKKKAIGELGYGTNAKVMMGVNRRIWREQGYGGNLFSDEPFQLAWDSSRCQAGVAGGLTALGGGKGGVAFSEGTPAEQVTRLLPGIGKAWRGIGDVSNGKTSRFHWPSHPHTKGSYASYKVGQWRTIRGKEFGAVGRLHFAGEHTSLVAQGYMEGGAETGKRAAMAILKQVT